MKNLLIILFLFCSTLASAQIGDSDISLGRKATTSNIISVFSTEGLFALQSKSGQYLTKFEFSDIRAFKNGLAAIEKNNKWGFIDIKGEIIIPIEYDIVFDFDENVTLVYKNNQWLAINLKGKTEFAPLIDKCDGFHNSISNVEVKGIKGILKITGEISLSTKKVSTFTTKANSQSNISGINCPNNIDFENGSFDGWQCFTGSVDTIGNTNVISVVPSAPISNRHKVYARSEAGNLDQYGLFSTNSPDGSNYAVKLGNKNSGAQAERIRYAIHVPENVTDYSIRYDYAVVFQDPGHTDCSQPRFVSKLFDSAANAYVDCASYEYISTSNLPGFAVSAVDPFVIYKPWSSVYVNLKAFAGKTMYLEFTTADCARRAHWGYAYLDVETGCQASIQTQFDCATPAITNVTAPFGFQLYNWWNADYSVLLGTGQTADINNTTGENIHLEMIPFNGFGCRDTLTIELNNYSSPSIEISNEVISCTEKVYTFKCNNYASTPNWDFGDGSSASGDSVSHVYNQTGEYVVTLMTTSIGGCNIIKTDTINIINYIEGEITIDTTRKCGFTSITAGFSNNINGTIEWNFGDGSTAVGNNLVHDYLASGLYVINATIQTNSGCVFQKSKFINIIIDSLPTIGIVSPDQICSSTDFYAKAMISGSNGNNTILWNVPTTNIVNSDSILLSINQPGTFTLSLKIITGNGCEVSTTKNIVVNEKPQMNSISGLSLCAGVNSDSIIPTCNLNDVTYFWSNSNTAIGLSANGQHYIPGFTTPLNNETALTAQISVYALSNNGCYSDTNYFTINVNPKPFFTISDTIHQCSGSTFEVNLTNTLQYQWYPAAGLNCSNCSTTEINATQNTLYSVEATDNNGCKSIDSVFVDVIKPISISINAQDTICPGKSVHLQANGASQYQWTPVIGLDNPNTSDPIASPSSNTNYTVIGIDQFGCFSDTDVVFVAASQMTRNDVTGEVAAIAGSTVTLVPSLLQNNITTYEWSPTVNLSCYDCATPQVNVESNITYTLKTTNNKGCVTEQNIDIKLLSQKIALFIPNTFSPDGNGMNDVLFIRGKGFVVKSFRLFNRNGKLVFQKNNFAPNDINAGWDGKCSGHIQPSDTYIYIAEIVGNDGTTSISKGNTTLLR